MNFYSFCIVNGKYPFANQDELIDPEIGSLALENMKELYALIDPKFSLQ